MAFTPERLALDDGGMPAAPQSTLLLSRAIEHNEALLFSIDSRDKARIFRNATSARGRRSPHTRLGSHPSMSTSAQRLLSCHLLYDTLPHVTHRPARCSAASALLLCMLSAARAQSTPLSSPPRGAGPRSPALAERAFIFSAESWCSAHPGLLGASSHHGPMQVTGPRRVAARALLCPDHESPRVRVNLCTDAITPRAGPMTSLLANIWACSK